MKADFSAFASAIEYYIWLARATGLNPDPIRRRD